MQQDRHEKIVSVFSKLFFAFVSLSFCRRLAWIRIAPDVGQWINHELKRWMGGNLRRFSTDVIFEHALKCNEKPRVGAAVRF